MAAGGCLSLKKKNQKKKPFQMLIDGGVATRSCLKGFTKRCADSEEIHPETAAACRDRFSFDELFGLILSLFSKKENLPLALLCGRRIKRRSLPDWPCTLSNGSTHLLSIIGAPEGPT